MLNRGRHYQSDLADYLRCSPQTVIRMIGEIEAEIGLALESGTDNRRRWYEIKPSGRNTLALNYEELRYLAICRDLASTTLPKEVLKRVDESLLKLAMQLSDVDSIKRRKATTPNYAFYAKGRIDYGPHQEHIHALEEALDKRVICILRYKKSGSSEVSELKFAPARFASMNGSLYILGTATAEDFSRAGGLRSLAIHRIRDVILTSKLISFDIPKADPQDFGLPWHEPKSFTVTFRAGKAADYVRERTWSPTQTMEDLPDGSLKLGITTSSGPELLSWARSFGEEVTEVTLAGKVLDNLNKLDFTRLSDLL
ncbi:MAG: WYL domain-containing protein [Succinivibrio sp.]|nr:WYL domain-containing protein [Succinivibrio sp.]